MNYKYIFICVLVSTSLLTSCAKKEADSLSSVAPLTSLEGTWNAACYDDNMFGRTSTTSLTASGTFTRTFEAYQLGNCSSPAFTQVETGTYAVSNISNMVVAQQGDLDVTYTTMNITPSSPSGAALMNSYSYCGFNSWTSGVTKSILGANCFTETMPTNGQTIYSIFFYVLNSSLVNEGLTPGDLMFGFSEPDHDGTSPASRHEYTDGMFLYRK